MPTPTSPEWASPILVDFQKYFDQLAVRIGLDHRGECRPVAMSPPRGGGQCGNDRVYLASQSEGLGMRESSLAVAARRISDATTVRGLFP